MELIDQCKELRALTMARRNSTVALVSEEVTTSNSNNFATVYCIMKEVFFRWYVRDDNDRPHIHDNEQLKSWKIE